jgi:protein-S-isoprenylcysteine O-methyltransferase Ste14
MSLLLSQSILWSLTLGDITMVLLSNDLLPTVWKDNAVKYLAKYISWNVPDVGITPLFLLGSALCVLGCRFRSASYEALGRHFTFELAIRPDHELVTSYPYNIVRHPSYTGGFVGAVGLNLASFVARGGLVQEVIVPWAQTTSKGAIFIQVAGWGLFLLQTFVIGGLTARCSSEDVMLKKRFGKEWEEWAKRVPYKLLPGIY